MFSTNIFDFSTVVHFLSCTILPFGTGSWFILRIFPPGGLIMFRLLFCFFILFSFYVASVQTAELPPGDHALTFKSSYDGSDQPYRLFIPQISKTESRLPLLVALHGKWVDENAWFDYTPVKVYGEKHAYVISAPYARGDYFYRGPGEQDVMDIISIVKEKCSIDSSRVYLMGHSMGGWGTWWIGLRNQDTFACLCPMSGYAPEYLLPNAFHTDPYIIHSEDDPIVDISGSRIPASILPEIGVSMRYREEHGYGHSSKMIGDNLPRLFAWMNNHRRKERPERIRLVTKTPAKGEAWWVRILSTIDYPKPSSVTAEFTEPGELKIETRNVAKFTLDPRKMPFPEEASFQLSIDEGKLAIQRNDQIVLLSRKEKNGSWETDYKSQSEIPEYKSPVIAELARDSAEATSLTLMTNAAAKLLCEETGADLCLFLDDSFAFPGGPVTADAALDLYVYPEEKLAKFTYSGQDLPSLITKVPRLFPLEKYDPRLKRLWTVIAPVDLASRMDIKSEPLSKDIGEYMFRALKDRNAFPVEK